MLGIFLDTETNGLNSQVHRILELAFQIVDLSTGEVEEAFQSVVAVEKDVWERSDPGSLKVNGFKWEEIEKGRSAETLSNMVVDIFARWGIRRGEAVFICQNPSFDRAFFSQVVDADLQEGLQWPYHWLDLASMFWAVSMDKAKRGEEPLPWEVGCSKDLIAAHYGLPKESTPHRAMNGVDHLLACYRAVVGFPQEDLA